MKKRRLLGLIIGCVLCVTSLGMTSNANECTNINNGVKSDSIVSTLQEKEEAAIENIINYLLNGQKTSL